MRADSDGGSAVITAEQLMKAEHWQTAYLPVSLHRELDALRGARTDTSASADSPSDLSL